LKYLFIRPMPFLSLLPPPPPLNTLCVFEARAHTHKHTYTHATQIHKSHDILNDTPETRILWYGQSKTHRTDHTFDTRPRL